MNIESPEIGTEVFEAGAVAAANWKRETLCQRFAARSPQLALYQARTPRQFPIVTLVPGNLRVRIGGTAR